MLALRAWQNYLLGNVIHIYMGHKSLKYILTQPDLNMRHIFTQPDLNMRHLRWLELIKDYELEVLYHLGKANVVVYALSRKAHCNYLPVVPLTREESSVRVLLDLSLYNITLTPLLREEIIVTQSNDEGMVHIRRRMWKVLYGSKIGWLCQRDKL
jgi:hypothetical protein